MIIQALKLRNRFVERWKSHGPALGTALLYVFRFQCIYEYCIYREPVITTYTIAVTLDFTQNKRIVYIESYHFAVGNTTAHKHYSIGRSDGCRLSDRCYSTGTTYTSEYIYSCSYQSGQTDNNNTTTTTAATTTTGPTCQSTEECVQAV